MARSPLSITTTIFPAVFTGSNNLQALALKNGSTTGIIYLRNRQISQTAVSSTDYDVILNAGDSISFNRVFDGDSIMGPWDAISDTAGGVNLMILPLWKPSRSY